MVLRLLETGHEVVAYNRSPEPVQKAANEGAIPANSVEELVDKLISEEPKIVWIMVPHDAVNEVIEKLIPPLKTGDIIVDGGNSFYKDSAHRANKLAASEIEFVDVGVSGGPNGARNGASLMVGGKREMFGTLDPILRDLAVKNGYAYLGEAGAGHFAKMVHNGIEYGMMQAIAEGFDILKHSEYDFSLREIMRPYANGSVIKSELVSWLANAFEKYGEDLDEVSGSADNSGEAEWAVKTAGEMGIQTKVIEDSLNIRIQSQLNPNYQGKIISAMRGEFGGHKVQKEEKENPK